MNLYLKTLLLLVAIGGLFVPATAFAQKSAGGVIGDARLHPGTWSDRSTSRSMRSQPTYRSSAPVVVRSESAPTSPTEQRSYSYEPSQKAQSSSGGCGCGSSAKTEDAVPKTARSTDNRRSYSYEPSINDSSSAPRTYSAPRTRSSRPSQQSWLSGSKAERNNYRN